MAFIPEFAFWKRPWNTIRQRGPLPLALILWVYLSQVMGMPMGYKPHRLLAEQSHSLITWLAERNDLELAKIWDVPFEILQVGKIGGQALKKTKPETAGCFFRTKVRSKHSATPCNPRLAGKKFGKNSKNRIFLFQNPILSPPFTNPILHIHKQRLD